MRLIRILGTFTAAIFIWRHASRFCPCSKAQPTKQKVMAVMQLTALVTNVRCSSRVKKYTIDFFGWVSGKTTINTKILSESATLSEFIWSLTNTQQTHTYCRYWNVLLVHIFSSYIWCGITSYLPTKVIRTRCHRYCTDGVSLRELERRIIVNGYDHGHPFRWWCVERVLSCVNLRTLVWVRTASRLDQGEERQLPEFKNTLSVLLINSAASLGTRYTKATNSGCRRLLGYSDTEAKY